MPDLQLAAPLGGTLIVGLCAVVLLLAGTLWANPIKNQALKYSTLLYGDPTVSAVTADDPDSATARADEHDDNR